MEMDITKDKVRKAAIREIEEDFNDIQIWLKELCPDKTSTDDLLKINKGLGIAWLTLYRIRLFK